MGHYDADDGKLVVIVNHSGVRTIRGAVVDMRVRSRASGRTVERLRIEVSPLCPGYSVRRLRPGSVVAEPVDVEARIARVIV